MFVLVGALTGAHTRRRRGKKETRLRFCDKIKHSCGAAAPVACHRVRTDAQQTRPAGFFDRGAACRKLTRLPGIQPERCKDSAEGLAADESRRLVCRHARSKSSQTLRASAQPASIIADEAIAANASRTSELVAVQISLHETPPPRSLTAETTRGKQPCPTKPAHQQIHQTGRNYNKA